MSHPLMEAALKDIAVSSTIGFADIVMIFVSKHETALFDAKDDLQRQIKQAECEANDLEKQLITELKGRLRKVKDAIKQIDRTQVGGTRISRKERQIRGKLAELRLGVHGMAALLQNEELLKLSHSTE